MKYYIGTSGWSYDDWKGRFYPEGTAKKKWLQYYASQFNTVEINAAFYRRFQPKTYKGWAEKAEPGFKYVVKAPQLITHRKFLKDVDDNCKEFAESASHLGDKFGLILLQLHPKMPYEPERLRKAI